MSRDLYNSRSTTFNLSPALKLRLLGVFPLLFFCAQAIHYWRLEQLGHLLWMCNIGNLVLAIGLFTRQRHVIQVAVIWMFPGLVIWFLYVVLAWGVFLSSTLAHIGGLMVALIALRKYGVERRTWLYAFVWYLLVQLCSRLFTDAALNVNLAHHIQPGFETRFGSYWKFWIALTITTAVGLWALNTVLLRLTPVFRDHSTDLVSD